MIAIKYSFNFRYQREIPREVIIPAEKLAGLNLLDGDLHWSIRKLIDDDWELQEALFGDYLREYETMVAEYEFYSKDLERERERAEIVVLDA